AFVDIGIVAVGFEPPGKALHWRGEGELRQLIGIVEILHQLRVGLPEHDLQVFLVAPDDDVQLADIAEAGRPVGGLETGAGFAGKLQRALARILLALWLGERELDTGSLEPADPLSDLLDQFASLISGRSDQAENDQSQAAEDQATAQGLSGRMVEDAVEP